MNLRSAFLPLLLAPTLVLAQDPSDPELCINAPPELEVCLNNYTFDYPEPYSDVDTTGAPLPYTIGAALFGAPYTDEGVTGNLSLTFDELGEITGCVPIVTDLTGKIAFIERGGPIDPPCYFNTKAYHAEQAGALGVVIFNQEDRPDDVAINLSAGDSSVVVNIPVVHLPRFLALPILDALNDSVMVNATIRAYDPFTASEPGPATRLAFGVAPNPATSGVTLSLSLPERQAVRVEAFDALGRRVATVHDGVLAAGIEHRMTLDGRGLPPGVYVVRVSVEDFAGTRRVTLLH